MNAEEPYGENLTIYRLVIPFLQRPAATMLLIFVNTAFTAAFTSTVKGHAALLQVLLWRQTPFLCLTIVAKGLPNEQLTMVVSRVITTMLVGLPVQYVIDVLTKAALPF